MSTDVVRDLTYAVVETTFIHGLPFQGSSAGVKAIILKSERDTFSDRVRNNVLAYL